MADRKKPYLGQITFQLPPEVQAEMLQIARTLGLGSLSGFTRMIIQEALPSYRTRARAVEEAARKYQAE